MNEESQARLHGEDLAFFGKIGADVSHEMRNVLSVIGEYAGLVDDLLASAGRRRKLDFEKLQKLAASITRQVKKGTATMERFNRFAHAADAELASFDLTSLTENVTALAQRHVALAGCGLEADLPDEAIPVRANPFCLQRAVFAAIELVLASLEKGGSVTIRLLGQGPTALISVSGSATGGADELSDRTSQLSAVMNELKGSIETSRENGILSLILTIPIQ